MIAVILAAGRGSRLGSLTDSKPKTLVEFKGETLLAHTLDILSSFFDCANIYVVAGYKSHLIKQIFPNVIVNEKWDSTNIGGSLLCMSSVLEREPVLFLYGDIYFEGSAISEIVNSRQSCLISLQNWHQIWSSRFENPEKDLESFKVDANGNLTEIGEKNPKISEVKGQFAGIFLIQPREWQVISQLGEKNISSFDITTLINKSLNLGVQFKVLNCKSFWAEIDSPDDVIAQS